jgi:hypothetical protein
MDDGNAVAEAMHRQLLEAADAGDVWDQAYAAVGEALKRMPEPTSWTGVGDGEDGRWPVALLAHTEDALFALRGKTIDDTAVDVAVRMVRLADINHVEVVQQTRIQYPQKYEHLEVWVFTAGETRVEIAIDLRRSRQVEDRQGFALSLARQCGWNADQ